MKTLTKREKRLHRIEQADDALLSLVTQQSESFDLDSGEGMAIYMLVK